MNLDKRDKVKAIIDRECPERDKNKADCNIHATTRTPCFSECTRNLALANEIMEAME